MQTNKKLLLICVGLCWILGCNKKQTNFAMPNLSEKEIDPFADEGELIEETWESRLMQDAKIGNRHRTVFKWMRGGQELRRIVSLDQFEVRRFGASTTQSLKQVSVETPSGEVLALGYEQSSGREKSRWTGRVDAAQLILTSDSGQNERRIPWNDRNASIFAIEHSLQNVPMSQDEERVVRVFRPLADVVATVNLNAVGMDDVELPTGQRQLLKVEATDGAQDGWSNLITYWVDDQGEIQKSRNSFMNWLTVRETEAEATRMNDALGFDVGIDSGIPLNEDFSNAQKASMAVYRIQSKNIEPKHIFFSGPGQSVLSSSDRSAIVTVRRIGIQDLPDETRTPPTLADLSSNRYIESNNKMIRLKAEAAVGSVTDPFKSAKILQRWVHFELDKNQVGQVFDTASEVAKKKSGDCSEHAVLLAALCRARGLHARVVVGLVYSRENSSFLFHMWNEIWINDRWIAFDATSYQSEVSADHLKFRDSSLAGQSPYSLLTPVASIVGQLEIELISAEYD